MVKRVAGLLVMTLLAAACCPCEQRRAAGIDRDKLPPPISLDDQLSRLDARAEALTRIKATTVVRGVEFKYRNKDGQDKTENVEGTLMLRRHGDGTADVRLIGKAFDQEVFDAGKNAEQWWFAVRLDSKQAWVGDARKPLDWKQFDGHHGKAIVRADLVPELLGLTLLKPLMGTDRSEVVMRVNDLEGTNDLWVIDANHLRRELVVDRFTSELREVRMYDPAGVMVVRSVLTDYRAVEVQGDAPALPAGVTMPRKVRIEYPAAHVSVGMEFEQVMMPAKFGVISFTLPDFAEQGLKVERAE